MKMVIAMTEVATVKGSVMTLITTMREIYTSPATTQMMRIA